MNLRRFSTSLLIAMICLSVVTGMVVAQQPIGSTFEAGAVPDATDSSGLLQEPLIVRPSPDTEPRRSFIPPQDEDTPGQSVVVNTTFAGWEEVMETARGERVSDTIRANWIMVDPNGRIEGTVAAVYGADVSNMNIFMLNNGRLVKQTTLGADRRFEFNNVRQGTYALIGWGPNGFFAFGLNILNYNPLNNGEIVNVVRATAYQNETTINTDWIQYFAPLVNFRVYGRYPVGEGRDDPEELFGFQGAYEHLPQAILATSISGRRVVKNADGGLLGRVHQMNSINGRPVDVRSTKVMLFQGDEVVASTTTDNYGGFSFQQVPDGAYGVTAAGVDGVGMIAIDVVTGNAEITPAPIDFAMVPSESIGWLKDYASEVAYNRALLATRPPGPEEGDICPYCGNAGCNGCQPYANCKSRSISFEQWSQAGCQATAQKYGDGSILAGWTAQQRINIQKSNARTDRAFYPNQNLQGLYNQNPGVPILPGGNPNPGFYNQGYPNQ